MPAKMVKLCRGKAVLVSVYEEKPKKKPLMASLSKKKKSKNNPSQGKEVVHHHHHHLYVHHDVKQDMVMHNQGHNAGIGGGGNGVGIGRNSNSNRRAALLLYARRLRESAPKKLESTQLVEYIPQLQQQKAVTPKTKKKAPTCIPKLMMLNPNILKPFKFLQINTKKKKTQTRSSTRNGSLQNVMKSIKGEKKKGFFSRWFATLKRR